MEQQEMRDPGREKILKKKNDIYAIVSMLCPFAVYFLSLITLEWNIEVRIAYCIDIFSFFILLLVPIFSAISLFRIGRHKNLKGQWMAITGILLTTALMCLTGLYL